MFITLDGIDGGGKSTQLSLLADHLTGLGHRVTKLRDPGGTRLGEAVRDILLHRQEIPLAVRAEMLLYMASRAQLVSEAIVPALDRGEIVVCDRYLLANVVYQGCAGGLEVDILWQVGRVATGGLEPDVTLLLDLPADVARQRLSGTADRLESRPLEYFQRVRQGFLDQLPRAGGRGYVLDALGSIESIQQQVRGLVAAGLSGGTP
jgi:dTMP kinase